MIVPRGVKSSARQDTNLYMILTRHSTVYPHRTRVERYEYVVCLGWRDIRADHQTMQKSTNQFTRIVTIITQSNFNRTCVLMVKKDWNILTSRECAPSNCLYQFSTNLFEIVGQCTVSWSHCLVTYSAIFVNYRDTSLSQPSRVENVSNFLFTNLFGVIRQFMVVQWDRYIMNHHKKKKKNEFRN